MTCEINIAEEFSRTPAGRTYSDGPFSGQRFRDEILVPALRSNAQIVVNLNGVYGYGSSFLEEAFGGLVRKDHFTKEEITSKMRVISPLAIYERKIWKYINTARPE